MLYSELKPNIKNGDLLIWRITKIDSLLDFILYLYQKIFKTKYSHVGLAMVYGNRVFCIEATPPVVRLIPLSKLDDFYYVPMDIEWKPNYEILLLRHIGKKYNLFDLIKSILKMKTDDNELYCSELVANFYKEIGKLNTIDSGKTPKRLVERILEKFNKTPTMVNIDRGNSDAV